MNELFNKLKKLPKRRQIEIALAGLLVLVLIIVLIWAIITGRIKPKAAPAQISNMASVTYHDANGQTFSVNSNVVLVDVVSGSSVFNLNFNLQGRKTNFLGSNISLNIYPVGQTTPVANKTDITSDATGLASFTMDGIAPGNYDLTLRVPNFLSVKKTNLAITNTNSIDFGQLPSGDLNIDNQIYLPDYSVLIGSWGKKTGDANFNSVTDLNSDGQVYLPDYSILISNWGKTGE